MHRVANVHQDSVPHTPAAGVWEPVEAKWSALMVFKRAAQLPTHLMVLNLKKSTADN